MLLEAELGMVVQVAADGEDVAAEVVRRPQDPFFQTPSPSAAAPVPALDA